MPEKKKQHFVAQFYLKNYSADHDRRSISLYVIDSDRHVPAAPIKGQCYRDFFYGRDGVEDQLSKLESLASAIIAKAIAGNVLPERNSEGHLALLTFALFQCVRTPVMAAALNEGAEKMVRMIGSYIPDLKDKAEGITVNDHDAPVKALRMATEIRPFAIDLKWKLLENKTRRTFITSDNPAIQYNQFLEKRHLLGSNIGVASKGLQIFLPLGPRHLLMLYDGDVYRVGGRRHLETHIELFREADVEALNVLQAANADEVLYFSAETDIVHVREAIERAKAHRRTDLVDVKEHRAIGPDGKESTLIQESRVDLRIGLVLDFAVIQPAVGGQHLPLRAMHLRNPDLARRFEETRLPTGPCDAREFVESFLSQ